MSQSRLLELILNGVRNIYRIFAHQMPDSRGLPALCLRYQSQEEDDLWEQRARQDDVRAAIEGSLKGGAEAGGGEGREDGSEL